jgi:peroxiredoxin (alkyl hydroperoxide reductase subunit C)
MGSGWYYRVIANVNMFSTLRRKKIMSLIGTEVLPFKAQAFHNGKFIEVTEASFKKMECCLLLPCGLHIRMPNRARGSAKPIRDSAVAGC